MSNPDPDLGTQDAAPDASESHIGLRERKKDATKRALSATALRLAQEAGYHSFTIADVCARVGVSRRTFSNYFSGKAECVVGACETWMSAVFRDVHATPRGTGLVDLMLLVVLNIDDATLAEMEQFNLLTQAEPELQAQAFAIDQQMTADISAELGLLLSADPGDVRIRLLAAFAMAATRTCLDGWLLTGRPGGRDGLRDLMHLAMTVIDTAAVERLAADAAPTT